MNSISLSKKIEENLPHSDASSVRFSVIPGSYDPHDDVFSEEWNPDLVTDVLYDQVETIINKFQNCPSPARNLNFLNTVTGRQCPVPCNKYSCPVCGPKKAKQLYKAIHNWLLQFDKIRMWTLTLSGSIVQDNFEHYKILQEAWRRFITEIRRSKFLTAKQNNIQYVRVAELHEGQHNSNSEIKNIGKVHFHVFVTEYIEVKFIQSVWNHILQQLTGQQCKVGNVNMKMIPDPETASHYVTNYVLKSAKLLEARQKKWTKSGKVSIMTKFSGTGEWIIINLCIPFEDNFIELSPFSSYNFKNIGTTSHELSGLPPPISGNIQIALFDNSLSRKISNAITD